MLSNVANVEIKVVKKVYVGKNVDASKNFDVKKFDIKLDNIYFVLIM